MHWQNAGVAVCLEGMCRAAKLTLLREIPPLASFQFTVFLPVPTPQPWTLNRDPQTLNPDP